MGARDRLYFKEYRVQVSAPLENVASFLSQLIILGTGKNAVLELNTTAAGIFTGVMDRDGTLGAPVLNNYDAPIPTDNKGWQELSTDLAPATFEIATKSPVKFEVHPGWSLPARSLRIGEGFLRFHEGTDLFSDEKIAREVREGKPFHVKDVNLSHGQNKRGVFTSELVVRHKRFPTAQ
jgi:hypothetical protein